MKIESLPQLEFCVQTLGVRLACDERMGGEKSKSKTPQYTINPGPRIYPSLSPQVRERSIDNSIVFTKHSKVRFLSRWLVTLAYGRR
jgi:hypothetical protein